MKKLAILLLAAFVIPVCYGQKERVRDLDNRGKQFAVKLFEHANYGGQLRNFNAGQFLLSDFNDQASSIKVTPGYCALVYEHADGGGGYGYMADFLEDCPDLSMYKFNDKVSYVVVFNIMGRTGFMYVRGQDKNGQFVPGHWERLRANQPNPVNPTVVTIGPPLPSTVGPAVVETVLQVIGPVTTIATLGTQNDEGKFQSLTASKQLGVVGNNFRGSEEIGSACFERESTSKFIPNNINFWYLQRAPNDHRPYFKRTLCGTVLKSKQVRIVDTYPDYDVNINIRPDPDYMYLLTDAKPREYTTIMNLQWEASKVSIDNLLTKPAWNWEGSSGQASCDDPETIEEFENIEVEIAPEYWPQNNHPFGRARLTDMALIRTGKKMCAYGVWIWDEGHCRHAEIHPAEQLWWSDPDGTGMKYTCNVFCDASKRFWWRHQMDDGTKMHPWGAPPVKGLFAIAFDVPLTLNDAAIGNVAKRFEVSNIEDYNVMEYPNANQVYLLNYQGRTLVSFIPRNNAFRVSFEHVGLDPVTNSVKGFLVIETSVGTVTQIATEAYVPSGRNIVKITIPPNSDPDHIAEQYEERFFKKVEGRYQFNIIQTTVTARPGEKVIQ